MAKQRLFPEPEQPSDDKAGTRQNFEQLATKIFTVPKSDIDAREQEWRKSKSRKHE